MAGVPWTEKELADLLREYPIYGVQCPSLIQSRSVEAIKKRANQLGLVNPLKHYWTAQEDEILHEKYKTMGTAIPELRENHTRAAILARAQKFGLKCSDIPDKVTFLGDVCEYSEFLRRCNVSKATVHKLRDALNMSIQEICSYLERFYLPTSEGLLRTATFLVYPEDRYIHAIGKYWGVSHYISYFKPTWTREQYVNVRNNYGYTATEAAAFLSDDKLLRKVFTEEENKIIARNADKSAEEIAQMLGRGRDATSVYERAKRMGIKVRTRDGVVPIFISNLKSVRKSASAYTGLDGRVYYFLICATCGRVVCLPFDSAVSFRHGDTCITYEIPAGVQLPESIRWAK